MVYYCRLHGFTRDIYESLLDVGTIALLAIDFLIRCGKDITRLKESALYRNINIDLDKGRSVSTLSL